MRAVLRTLAQCHAQHILHRDIKPGEGPTRCLVSPGYIAADDQCMGSSYLHDTVRSGLRDPFT